MINLTIYDSYDDGKKFLKKLLFNFFDCEEYNLLSDDNKAILCKLLNHFSPSSRSGIDEKLSNALRSSLVSRCV